MVGRTKKFCSELKVPFREELVPYYEKGLKLKEEFRKSIVDMDRIEKLNQKYNFFRKWFDDVKTASKLIGNDENLLLLNYILYSIIKEDGDVNILQMPDRESMETDFAPMFALLWFLEEMIENMVKRGLPHVVISDTIQGFDAEINDYYGLYSRSGMRIYVNWFLLFVKCRIIRVGRLNFEFTTLKNRIRVYKKDDDIKILADGEYMHEKGMVFKSAGQSDEEGKYYADITVDGNRVTGYASNEYGECERKKITLEGYEEVLKPGDEVLSVHIPAEDTFTYELCKASMEEAREIVRKHYPEKNIRAFVCNSWMMEKRLKDIMGKDTNITRFAELFKAFPTLSSGKDVRTFLFHMPFDAKPFEYPKKTSMQKAVKKYICDGNHFYSKGGIALF